MRLRVLDYDVQRSAPPDEKKKTMTIDLNADLGESFGRWTLGDDEALLTSISSASVACGYHAGDPGVMRRTLRSAKGNGVAVGAHPGLPDLAGFGRRRMAVSPQELEDLVLYQVGALAAIAAAEGVRLRHVKPHGALYDMCTRERPLADALARAVASADGALVVFAPPGSALVQAAQGAGLPIAREGFADRLYEPDGSLTPRERPGAVIDSAREVIDRALRMVTEGLVRASNGQDVPLRVETLCLHGDTPGSGDLAGQLRAAFEAAGIDIRPPRSTSPGSA